MFRRLLQHVVFTTVLSTLCVTVGAQSASIIEDGNRGRISLDGTWDVIGVNGIIPQFPAPPASADWKTIQVPHRSAEPYLINKGAGPYTNGVVEKAVGKDGKYLRNENAVAWFKRSFKTPSAKDIAGRRIILYFHGLAYRSDVYLNGKLLGTSLQCLVPNSYDITDHLKPGKDNELLVGLTERDGIVDPQTQAALTPTSGVRAGIYGRVELQFLPTVRLDDVFVQTYVADKQFVLELTLLNKSDHDQTVTPMATVFDAQGVASCEVTDQPITIKAGQTKVIKLKKDWLADHLWSPEIPYLYNVRVQLHQNDQPVDMLQIPFGFREFTIKGTDFYLNGNKTRLLRISHLTYIPEEVEKALTGDIRSGTMREKSGRPVNSIRFHLGFNNEHQIRACDQLGFMAIPESGWYHVKEYNERGREKFLPNVLEYMERWIKLYRNHPSIVMWSLTNEHFWGRTGEVEMAIAKQVAQRAMQTDPTRPIQGDAEVTWDGTLPVINIHYPEGTSGDVRNVYPNSCLVIPNDLYWLKKGKLNTQAWRAEFVWDRPLVIGEYWDFGGDPDKKSSYCGDAIYDWERWRFDKVKKSPDSPYIDVVRKSTDVYRLQGVAGLNPWSGQQEDIMPTRGTRAMDFHPNFFAGEDATRKMIIFNESATRLDYPNLQCRIMVDGRTVWQKQVRVSGDAHNIQAVDVPIQIPNVAKPTKATFTAMMRFWSGGAFHQMGQRHTETIYIMPRTDLSDIKPQGIVVFDTHGDTTQTLTTLGMQVQGVKQIADDTLNNAKLLIVGRNTNPTPFRGKIINFAKQGGRVIVLSQESDFILGTGIPEPDTKHVASQVWKASPNHPVISAFGDEQFSYWKPNHIGTKFNFTKLSVGGIRYLLHSGGLGGMSWSPLVEVPQNKGTILLCQMQVIDAAKVEPMAGALLKSMIQYALDYTTPETKPLRVLANSDSVTQVLKAAGVSFTNGLEGGGPILVDATHHLNSDEIHEINSTLSRGGKVWLHGYDATNVQAVSEILGFQPAMSKRDDTVHTIALRGTNPLLDGLSNHDYFWSKVELGARRDYFEKSNPTAPIGGLDVLDLPTLDRGQVLGAPALMLDIPRDSGHIFFDGVTWDKAYATEPGRVCRIVGTLAMNMGATIDISPEREFTYFPVSLVNHANRAFFDQEAGDGKGGWTDQGPDNDMSFFLINHTGKFNGMDVTSVKFPVLQTFAKRPFLLIDPTRNNGKAVLTFTGGGHDPAALKQAKDIKVNRKATTLWFLQTACWVNNIKDAGKTQLRYVIHFDDGTSVNFDQRVGLELAEWWNPNQLAAAQVGWSGRNNMHSPIGIFVTPWENPYPNKTIQSIDAIGNLGKAQVVLLAITGGVERRD
ncbi:MAG: glycoside hydrolase family 2 protein [Phycisphaeraceae bacterium JB051]